MGKSFNSVKDLMNYLEKQVEESLKDAAPEVEQDLKNSIDSEVYATSIYIPKKYKRTYELRESVDSHVLKDMDGSLNLEVFNNVAMINPYTDTGQHTSVLDGTDQSRWIPLWTALGHGGIWHMPKRNYFEHARQKIDAKKLLKDKLKKRGIMAE